MRKICTCHSQVVSKSFTLKKKRMFFNHSDRVKDHKLTKKRFQLCQADFFKILLIEKNNPLIVNVKKLSALKLSFVRQIHLQSEPC